MHPACAAEWTFLTDLPSTIAFVESFGSPYLKMVVDVYHFGHDRSVIANLREILPHTALIQLGDRRCAHGIDQNRCPLGTGIVPLEEILQNLLEAGYRGDFDVELVGQDIQLCDYQYLLQTSKQTFDRLLSPVRER
jgi:sugar phosphate isomerase/epimerase